MPQIHGGHVQPKRGMGMGMGMGADGVAGVRLSKSWAIEVNWCKVSWQLARNGRENHWLKPKIQLKLDEWEENLARSQVGIFKHIKGGEWELQKVAQRVRNTFKKYFKIFIKEN